MDTTKECRQFISRTNGGGLYQQGGPLSNRSVGWLESRGFAAVDSRQSMLKGPPREKAVARKKKRRTREYCLYGPVAPWFKTNATVSFIVLLMNMGRKINFIFSLRTEVVNPIT